jgi:hypothetical protein
VSETWTAEEVTTALAQEPERRGGRRICPLCGRDFATSGALGPHYAAHRRKVGLASPRKTRTRPSLATVTCPVCQQEMRKDNLRRHLTTVHTLSVAQAAQVLHPGELAPLNGQPLPDFNGAEAITGVLTAACPNGMIPVRVIPLVTQLVALTDAVLEEVRR